MILRKPYAILIKYFKTIHIVMFVFFSYLVFALRKIYIFFSDYIKTTSFTHYENMVDIYVPWLLFFLVIVLLGLAIGILLLMHKKEKPVLFYKIMIGYCFLLLGVLIYYVTFFNSLEKTVYEPLQIVVNRDISLFIYLFNFIFVIMTFIRGFGFDIKKFSFDRDKKELHLEDSDSEEYELNVNIEKEDIRNFLRRQRREFIYYFKGNKMFFTIIGSLILVCMILFIYFNFFVINKVYKENEVVSIGKLSYIVKSSIVTSVDKYGLELNKDNDFLVVNLNITNNSGTGYLDSQAFRVNIDEEYFYPTTIYCDSFSDLGECYKNQELKNDSSNDYVLIYKIGKNYKNINLEILKGKGDEYKYSKVILSYKKSSLENKEAKFNELITVDNNELKILSYKIYDKTSYKYEECISGKCSNYVKKVVPNTSEIIFALNIENAKDLSDDFLDSVIGLKHNNKIYEGKQVQLIDKNNNTVYYSVPALFKNTSNVSLVLTTRTIRYNILLEGE